MGMFSQSELFLLVFSIKIVKISSKKICSAILIGAQMNGWFLTQSWGIYLAYNNILGAKFNSTWLWGH